MLHTCSDFQGQLIGHCIRLQQASLIRNTDYTATVRKWYFAACIVLHYQLRKKLSFVVTCLFGKPCAVEPEFSDAKIINTKLKISVTNRSFNKRCDEIIYDSRSHII